MSHPLVSVIIPVWNTAPYLPDTLQSVAAQNYQNFEVIMVDDGSTDDSFDIIQNWADRDRRFKAIRQTSNKGVVAARNAALAVATGEYVAMLDGDDIWESEALATRVAVAQDFPDACVIATDFAWFDESVIPEVKGRVLQGPKARAFFAEAYAGGLPVYLEDAFAPVAELHFVWTGATLVHRAKMDDLGNFNPDFEGPEDTLLWLVLANKGAFVFIPTITAHYRQRSGSLVHSQHEPKEFHYLKVLEYLICQPDFFRHQRNIRRLMSECCVACVFHYRRQRCWNKAFKFAQRAVRLNPFVVNNWRNLAAILLRN